MASSESTSDVQDIGELKSDLYATCRTRGSDVIFTQEDFLSLGIIPDNDLTILTRCLNELDNEGLFKLMTKDGRPCWKAASKEDAAKYRHLGTEEALVFAYIESAGREGIWTKTIRSKSNLHQNVFTRCLKSLETKGLIKPTQNAKYPTRKLYILSHLQPSEEISGGPFFTDGFIDDEFVRQLCRWTEQYIDRNTRHVFGEGQKTSKYDKHGQDLSCQLNFESAIESIGQVPIVTGSTTYPRLRQITKAVNDAGVSQVTMKEAEVQQLLDLLCWDGRIVKTADGQAYRSAHITSLKDKDSKRSQGYENGLIGSPCGCCPVLDLCHDDGPVNARTCVYFQEWF